MRKHKTDKQYVREAAMQVAANSTVPSPNDLIIELADLEKRKQQLFQLLQIVRTSLERPLDDAEYQSLMDYLLMKAAQKNINSDELMVEVEFKFMVEDLRELPERNLWEAMKFIRSYE